jgi:transcriptional regulator with XRE-family HTH domain
MAGGPNTAPGPLSIAVSDFLRAEMGRRSLSDSGLSRLSGVHRSAIGKILKNKKVPDIEVLESLCVALGRSLTFVLKQAEGASEGRRFES